MNYPTSYWIYRIDLLVDNTLIVELKAMEQLLPIHEAPVDYLFKINWNKIGIAYKFQCFKA